MSNHTRGILVIIISYFGWGERKNELFAVDHPSDAYQWFKETSHAHVQPPQPTNNHSTIEY